MVHHNFARWPAPSEALAQAKASIDRLQWVGTTELYHESVCVLRYFVQGLVLPDECSCPDDDDDDNVNDSRNSSSGHHHHHLAHGHPVQHVGQGVADWTRSMLHPHIRHQVPAWASTLVNRTRDIELDALVHQLTRLDEEVYAYARDRALRDIAKVERWTKRRFKCA